MNNRIECLDGLRGLASLWVFAGHAILLAGFHFPIIGEPSLGVDLFIMISGFLMVYQYRIRESQEPWSLPDTWFKFWIRRFFRIAPLYYVVLIISFLLAAYHFNNQSLISIKFGREAPSPPDLSFLNFFTHISFLFGAIPSYSAYKTSLPDWSVGLEAQFYAVFPFLMITVLRLGWLKGTFLFAIIGVIIAKISYRVGLQYPFPSLLPLKLHLFLAGMIAASALGQAAKTIVIKCIAALVLVCLPIGGHISLYYNSIRFAIATVFLVMIFADVMPALARSVFLPISQLLGKTPFRLAGEFSYGLYLIHPMVMFAVYANLLPIESDATRFIANVAIALPICYGIAALGYYLVERPGQSLGRLAVHAISRNKGTGVSASL